MISTLVCATCNANEAKYKCPTCRSPYCSVVCCKLHKESTSCQAPAPSPAPTQQQQPVPWNPAPLNFQTADTVSTEKLAFLGKSAELRAVLANPHLQTLLTTVDQAPNASNIMEAAMQEPIFQEFADLCLKLIEPKKNIDLH